ncbi:MAG: protein kinase, partial [Planctomycetales bacterium]|nr:protein kinase [Planctomycetales bacterium]
MSETLKGEEVPSAATIEQLSEAYLAKLRNGASPSISDYARQYPHLSAEIRDVFPTLAMLERLRPTEVHETASLVIKKLGEYCIHREIGRGGMGIVFEAVHETLGRRVALKMLPLHLATDATLVERFHREAKLAARMHHTNIVPVFEIGNDEGVYFYAMQFINGLGLDKVLTEIRRIRGPAAGQPAGVTSTSCSSQHLLQSITGGLFAADSVVVSKSIAAAPCTHSSAAQSQSISAEKVASASCEAAAPGSHPSSVRLPGDAMVSDYSSAIQHYFRSIARVGLQIAEAVGYIHSQNLLHRDIKPGNLLLDTQGVVWVTDLGLAHDEESAGLTRTGDIVGTVRYMAPERFRGQVSPRSDLYSVGLTLYELLTLRPAFSRTDRSQLMHEILSVDPCRPKSLDARIPRDLETIVLKLIDREPERRYQTAHALAEDLRSFLGDRPIKARQSSPIERCWRWCRRNDVVAALLASVASLLLVMAIGGGLAALIFHEQAGQLTKQAEELRREQRQSTHRLYDALVAQARATRLSGQVGQRFDSLKALTEATLLASQLESVPAQLLSLRNEAIACMALTDVRLAQPTQRTPPRARILAFDPDLTRYAWSTDGGELHFYNSRDQHELFTLPGPGVRAHVGEFSPDGLRFAAKYHDSGPPIVKLWNLSTKEVEWESAGDQFAFSCDARAFALGQLDPECEIIDVQQREVIANWPSHARPSCLCFHPTESRLALGSLYSYEVQIKDVTTGEVLQ